MGEAPIVNIKDIELAKATLSIDRNVQLSMLTVQCSCGRTMTPNGDYFVCVCSTKVHIHRMNLYSPNKLKHIT